MLSVVLVGVIAWSVMARSSTSRTGGSATWRSARSRRERCGRTFDLLCLCRFFEEIGIEWTTAAATDLFDWLAWQGERSPTKGQLVVALGATRGAAPSTMNRRVAAARGLFEHAVMCGLLDRNPVPTPRRSSGLRGQRRGLLGHVASRRPAAPARLVRQERRLPESLAAEDVAVFLADLDTHRDRAIALLMLLGGLRATETRTLLLAEVDVGMRQVKVTGKGAKQRIVPVERDRLPRPPVHHRWARSQTGVQRGEPQLAVRPSCTSRRVNHTAMRSHEHAAKNSTVPSSPTRLCCPATWRYRAAITIAYHHTRARHVGAAPRNRHGSHARP